MPATTDFNVQTTTPSSPTNSSPSLTQSTSNVSSSTPSTSPPQPTTPPRSSRSRTRYPDLGRVPLHRRGTSKTYERLEDLLKEAGYKETRVFTPEREHERGEASPIAQEQSHGQQRSVRNSVGAFVGFLAGFMPAASRSTSSLGTHSEAYSPPVSPLAQRITHKPRDVPSSREHSPMTSSLESLEPTPRPNRFRHPSRTNTPHPPSSFYSHSQLSQQDLRRPTNRMVHRASDHYSYAHSQRSQLPPPSPKTPLHRPGSPLINAGPSYQHIAQPRPSRAGAYLRHIASVPNIPKRTATPHRSRRTLLLNDDSERESDVGQSSRAGNHDQPALPPTWIESVARAVLYGGMGAYIGGPSSSTLSLEGSQTPTLKTLRPMRSSLSQSSSSTSPQQRVKRSPRGNNVKMLAPPELFMKIERGKAGTSQGEVMRTRVVCRSAPASRAGSLVRGGTEEGRRRKEMRDGERDRDKDRGGRRAKERPHAVSGSKGRGRPAEKRLPSLTNTQTEGDKWLKSGKRVRPQNKDKGREGNKYINGWGMEGESSGEGEDGEAGLSSSEEEGELNLAQMLVNPKRQSSIVSLRRHLNDELSASGRPKRSTGLRMGRQLTSGTGQSSRSESLQQRIPEDRDWDGSEAEDWGQGWVRRNARKFNSEGEEDEDKFSGFLGEGRNASGNGGRFFGSGRSGVGGKRLGIPGGWSLIEGALKGFVTE
ncbi:hypothetical protein H0H92_006502 [Tricholoma furcatifolium]|nr:hypothetical protein H0H92_006502 [Tricholoma furcatifolium]